MVLHLISDIDVLYLTIHCVAREQVYSESVFLIYKFVLPHRLQYIKLIVCCRWPVPYMACTTRFFGRMVTGSGMLTVVTGGPPTDSITERRSIELYNYVSKSSADALSSSFIDDLATVPCF